MFNKVKESLVYPVADPNWLSRVGYWLLYYMLGVTSPAIFGHYLKIVEQTATDEDTETIPAFDDFWELWKRGFSALFGIGILQMVPALLNMALFFGVLGADDPQPGGPPTMLLTWMIIHSALCFGSFLIYPACLVQVVRTKSWTSVFKLGEVLQIIRANIGAYFVLAVFPFACWIGMILLCFTGIGIILMFPLMPLVFFAHARLTGHYYRDHVL